MPVSYDMLTEKNYNLRLRVAELEAERDDPNWVRVRRETNEARDKRLQEALKEAMRLKEENECNVAWCEVMIDRVERAEEEVELLRDLLKMLCITEEDKTFGCSVEVTPGLAQRIRKEIE